ncbi:MAG: TIGR02206 family membrane protein [Verrucomicrobiales bacterium]
MPSPFFVVFSPAHLATIGVVAVVAGGMIAVARTGRWPRLERAQEWMLVGLLLLSWPADWLSACYSNHVTWEEILPLHLCDIASFAGAVALAWRHQRAAELTYFWAMAGTLNGLITPTVKYAFPHPSYLAFFLLHGSVVTAAAYLVGGRRLWPEPGAVRRVFMASLAYLIAIIAINSLLGTNFAFVRQKPESASLFDILGPWPWYVLALIPLALAFFSLLYLPFWLLRRLERQ